MLGPQNHECPSKQQQHSQALCNHFIHTNIHMAAISNPSISFPPSQSTTTSPSLKSIKKVFSGRRRSSEVHSEDGPRNSIDSIRLDRTSTIPSTQSSPSRDGSSKSGHSHNGIKRLIPGHEKRERRRRRKSELQAAADIDFRGRSPEPPPLLPHAVANRSNSSLLTDGSDSDT